MQSKDHKALAAYLAAGLSSETPFIYKKAFQIGNVEPDRNVVTYLRGAKTCKALKGHHYVNILPVMRRVFSHLMRQEEYGVIEYYRLGKLMHYVADAFTFPHNEAFQGTLADHCQYEKELHAVMHEYLEEGATRRNRTHEKPYKFDVMSIRNFFEIECMHEKYLSHAGTCDIDCEYIVQAAELVCAAVLIHIGEVQSRMPEQSYRQTGATSGTAYGWQMASGESGIWQQADSYARMVSQGR